MYVLNEDIDMKAKVVAMARRLEELEMKKAQKVEAISETSVQVMPCSICQSYEHLVEECPTIPVVREMFGDQANVIDQFKPNKKCFIWQHLQFKLEEPSKFLLETKATSIHTTCSSTLAILES
ncbi:hypothetical protein CK203_098855 [Vitis vinifera]|uniref:Uncharacterized protein n=1 Tax=Vitis vinifera TaxID=29760 RepID=A0A438DDE2_VITVI|nr:hypothetical protein CK203_098855 [Vitis vinifera]